MTRPDAWRRALPEALQRWQTQGLLSMEQVQAILAAEGLSPHGARPAPAPWAVIVSATGALVLGLGVLALVGTNWQELPGWGKLLCVLLPMLGAYAGGYRLRDDPHREAHHLPALGAALYLLGGVLFGGLLALLAQAEQAPVDTSALLALWGLGLLMLGYAVKLPASLHLALPLGVVIPLLGVFGASPLSGLSTLEAACMVIAGVGAAMLVTARLHGPPGTHHILSHPWAFWGPPLMLGGIYALHHTTAQNFSAALGLCLLLALATVWLGQTWRRAAWINWGLLTTGLVILTVYFELLGSLAVTGVALVGAGVLLLALGWSLERARRHLSPDMEKRP